MLRCTIAIENGRNKRSASIMVPNPIFPLRCAAGTAKQLLLRKGWLCLTMNEISGTYVNLLFERVPPIGTLKPCHNVAELLKYSNSRAAVNRWRPSYGFENKV